MGWASEQAKARGGISLGVLTKLVTVVMFNGQNSPNASLCDKKWPNLNCCQATHTHASRLAWKASMGMHNSYSYWHALAVADAVPACIGPYDALVAQPIAIHPQPQALIRAQVQGRLKILAAHTDKATRITGGYIAPVR